MDIFCAHTSSIYICINSSEIHCSYYSACRLKKCLNKRKNINYVHFPKHCPAQFLVFLNSSVYILILGGTRHSLMCISTLTQIHTPILTFSGTWVKWNWYIVQYKTSYSFFFLVNVSLQRQELQHSRESFMQHQYVSSSLQLVWIPVTRSNK